MKERKTYHQVIGQNEQDDNSFLKMHKKSMKYECSSQKKFFEGMFFEGKFEKNINSFSVPPMDSASSPCNQKIFFEKEKETINKSQII